MASGGGRLENEATEAVVSPRLIRRRYNSLGLPYRGTILCLTYVVWCSTTALSSAAGTVETSSKRPLITQTAAGDVLLLNRVIQVLARGRVAMNPNSGDDFSVVTELPIKHGNFLKMPQASGRVQASDGSSNYSKGTLMQMIYQKALELNKMKNVGELSTTVSSNGNDLIPNDPNNNRGDIVGYTNNECPSSDLYMKENDECSAWKAFIFEYLFPWVLVLAILGNALTLAVYRSRYLKSAATVLLLAVKAQANLAFTCCLTMEMLHYFVADDSSFQEVYWRSRPYTLFLANYFDSLAVWCTLAITLETYICVSFPLSFRRWSKRRTIYVVIVCLMIASGLLHVAYPITRDVEPLPSCPPSHRYRMVIRDGWFYYDYERVYFFLHALAVISLPVLLMALFSVLIGYHFNRKPMGQRFSERRRCVLRITFATTLCTLVLQTPGLVVFAAAAIRGSTLEQNFSFCTVNVVTTFLTVLNAAAPFLVYLCLNETFRRLLFVQLGSRFAMRPSGLLCPENEDRLRGATNPGEFTEAEQSHCALSPTSNLNTPPRRNGSRNQLTEEQEQETARDQGRATPNCRRKEMPTPQDKQVPTSSVAVPTGDGSGKPSEAARIIVEETL